MQRLYDKDRVNLENQLDHYFNNRCEAIARGYSWLQKALRTTERQQNSLDVQREILLEMRYIKSIYKNWDLIRENVKKTDIDICGFPLWRLKNCISSLE